MPTYSYRCTECSNAFDIQQAFTDDSLTECPVCGGKLRKIFSAVGVTFTGSGFYRNDSRAADTAKGGTGSGSKSGGESSGASSSSSSSDSTSGSGGSGGGDSVTSKPSTPAKAPSAPASPASSSGS